ncbi:hypothetical protein LEP1GSC125_1601 [Leptospira mayottensis 200901122]|uniref:Uncharacterized protein n=1 Tax=Leptospira mayottensis 200901122 TaxID=1193010 RepID=A0AA87MTW0_9LEPT|nr:hypothetical protein LEP1GSC125_1601 [Leptospira mayottensis 200901122]
MSELYYILLIGLKTGGFPRVLLHCTGGAKQCNLLFFENDFL